MTTPDSQHSREALTTPVGVRTTCPQCGVQLDAFTTSCGACGAVVTGSGWDKERTEKVRIRLQEGVGQGYVLGDMLGRGGMGIVFKAKEVALDRDVALKVLAFDPVLNPDAYARFEREARLAAKLDHPNIVPIFSVGQGNGIAFYTMRMVRGGSVESMIGSGVALDVPHAITILKDVAAALDYAHAHGVVHRDIKPANILIGDSGHAMVADFGIARAFGGKDGGAGTTATGVVGSPAYMSPEQWRAEKVDGKADQYAMAILAFELLTGRRPFADSSMQELLRMHMAEEPPDIISFRETLPSHMSDVIRRAMSKDPADRFPTTSAFVEALGSGAKAASRESIQARSGGGGGASGSLAAIPVRSGGAASSAPTVRTPSPVPRPSAVPSAAPAAARAGAARGDASGKHSKWPWVGVILVALGFGGVIWKMRPPQREAPSTAVPAAAGLNLDSIAAVEKDLQRQIAEARKLAMDAEKRAEQLGSQRGTGTAPPPAHGHLYVFAYGGTPKLVIDGQQRNEAAPAVLELAPGRHTVSVAGQQQFFPADTIVMIAPEDTQTVVFKSARAQQLGARAFTSPRVDGRSAPPPADSSGAPSPNPAADPAGRGKPLTEAQWADIRQKLGFDPRTTDPRTVNMRALSPQQRQLYQRVLQMRDSIYRANKRP